MKSLFDEENQDKAEKEGEDEGEKEGKKEGGSGWTMVGLSMCAVEIVLYSWVGMSMVMHASDSMANNTLTPLTATLWYSVGASVSYVILTASALNLPPIECQRDPPEQGEELGPPSLAYALRNGVGALLTFASVFFHFLLIKTGGVLVGQASWAVLPTAYIVSSKTLWAISWAYEKKLGFLTDGVAIVCLVGLLIVHPESWWISILWITAKSQSILFDDKNRMVYGDDPRLATCWNSIGAAVISMLIGMQMDPSDTKIKNMVIPALVMFLIGLGKGALFLVFDAQRLKTNSDETGYAWKSNVRMGVTGFAFFARCFDDIVPIDGALFWCSFAASVGNRILRKRDAVANEAMEGGGE